MSDSYRIEDDASARRALTLGAILLIVVPFLQVAAQLWPLRLFNIEWRFGAANAVSSVLLLPFLGMLLLVVIGRITESVTLPRVVGVIALVIALCVGLSMVVFAMDALQLRQLVSSAQQNGFITTAARVAATSVIFVVSFAVLGLAGMNRPKRFSQPERKADRGVGLIVGQDYPKAQVEQ